MALSRVKTWTNEVLTYQDLNAEFNNILNNALSLISPLTGNLDMDGNTIILDGDQDTSIASSTDDTIFIAIGGSTIYTLTASIFDFNGKRLDLDVDNDTSVRADSDDTITFEIGGSDLITMTASALDINGLDLVLDADGDSKFADSGDDIIELWLQGMIAFSYVGDTASAVNGLTFTTSATGQDVTIMAHGTDTDIDIGLIPKGSGTLAVTNSITVDGGLLTGAVFNGNTTWNIGSTDDGNAASTTITVTGAALGDFAEVSTSATDMTSGWTLDGMVTAANTVTVVATNKTGITSNPGEATFYARVKART